MGLLDALGSDDAKLGIALLSASGYSPTPMSFGQRLGGALGQYNADKQSSSERALKLKLLQSQMDENASQNLLRNAQIADMQRKQTILGSVFGPGAPAGGSAASSTSVGMTPGVGSSVGSPPVAGMAPMGAPSGSRLASMTPDQLALLKTAGYDMTDIYKLATEPLEFKPGSLYRNRTNGQVESIPSVSQSGQASQIIPDSTAPGGYRVIVPNGAADAYKTYKDIDAGVSSGSKLIKVWNNDKKQEEYISEAEMLRRAGQGGGASPPPATVRPGTPANMRGGFTGTPDEIMGAINSYPEPVRSQMRQAYVNQTTGNNPAFDPMGTAALPPQADQGARPSSYAAGPSSQDQASSAFNNKMATEQGDILTKSYTAANDASNALAGIRESRKAMQAGAFQGTGADFKLGVMKFGQAVGVNIDPEKVANTDYLKSTLGNALLEKAKTLGSNPSNADASRITDIVGSIGKDPQAMSKILDWQEEMSMKAINGHNTRVGQAEGNGFKSQFDLRVPVPERSGNSPAKQILNNLPKNAPKGQRIRDTSTGKILQWNGLQWKEQ